MPAYAVALDARQQQLFNELKALISRETYPAEVMSYCTDSILLRYLRAREWDLNKAYTMLKGTLEWRHTYKPQLITEEEIRGPMAVGTMFATGFDKMRRPVVYVKPGGYSPNTSEQRVKYLVWMMEHVMNSMQDGIEQLTLVVDFGDYGKRSKTPDQRSTIQQIIQILQNHYPESLAVAVLMNSPWYFNALWKLMTPFVHPVTKAKLKWITGDARYLNTFLSEYIDNNNLITPYGGLNTHFPVHQVC